MDKCLALLGARRLYRRGDDDEADLKEGFDKWCVVATVAVPLFAARWPFEMRPALPTVCSCSHWRRSPFSAARPTFRPA